MGIEEEVNILTEEVKLEADTKQEKSQMMTNKLIYSIK